MRSTQRWTWVFAAALALGTAVPSPARGAQHEPPATADSGLGEIDYSQAESWLARPGLASAADQTPKDGGFSSLQTFAHADVFYVHPTTSMRKDLKNAPIDDADALGLARLMLMAQATAFNAVARVYAPRYRQITLATYALEEEDQQEPSNRAYEDVRRAFEYYMEHDNAGRPFFLVGHSQGANHAQRLLSEAIQGKPAQRLLVGAYLPGQPLPRSVFEDDLTRIPPCTRPAQTGCVAVWGTFGEVGAADLEAWEDNPYWNAARSRWVAPTGQSLVNVNPVSWSADAPRTAASRHRGAVPFGVPDTNFTRPRAHLLAVRDDGRYDFVTPALPPALFNDGGVFGGANYHVFDISLFWVDLRENARRRLAAFLRKEGARFPLLGSTAAVSAKVGQPFRFRIEAANLPASFRAEGLPAGLTLDSRSGVIAGVPRSAGVYPVIVSASNGTGSDHADLALTVEE